MAIAKQTIEESMKPVDTRKMAEAGLAAEDISRKMQKYYGDSNKPTIRATSFQQGLGTEKARQSDIQRQQQYIPKVYEATKGIEDRQTETQDNLAKFYDDWLLKSDELATKQNQTAREADLYARESQSQIDQKLKEIGFSAFKNDAQRQDALEKAYFDGAAEKQMLTSAITGEIKLNDIDNYFDIIMNDINQEMLDIKAWAEADIEAFKSNIDIKARNWGNIFSGLAELGKIGRDQLDVKDENGLTGWDKIKTFAGETWDSTVDTVQNILPENVGRESSFYE